MIVYKIKKKNEDLFSTGGSSPNWSKLGKIWKNIGALKNHLNLVYKVNDIYKDTEIIEYELAEKSNISTNILVDALKNKHEEKKKRLEEYLQQLREEKEKEQLRMLKEKYEKQLIKGEDEL